MLFKPTLLVVGLHNKLKYYRQVQYPNKKSCKLKKDKNKTAL